MIPTENGASSFKATASSGAAVSPFGAGIVAPQPPIPRMTATRAARVATGGRKLHDHPQARALRRIVRQAMLRVVVMFMCGSLPSVDFKSTPAA